ncbi:MAG: long-chain-fatty-acid--CoA ligase [Hyphomicrobiaceae bacterium]
MLKGMMMDRPLLVSSILDYAADVHTSTEIVSATIEGGLHRTTYGETRTRIARLANALRDLGVKPGDRVATLAWNGYRHFELYYAISGIGAVCHTINPRLFAGQLGYIVNHAQDTLLFFDLTFLPLVEQLAPTWPASLRYAAMTDRAHMPRETSLPDLLCYEDILATGAPSIVWPDFDENSACALCYTSGTTGDPKGVLYSNRAMVLHALFVLASCGASLKSGARILPVVPLFHANAWGLPYAAPLAGAALIFPGAKLDGESLFALMDAESVTASWGVPTVWLGVLAEMRKQGRKPHALQQVLTGGSAAPRSLIHALECDFGLDVTHGWGMTEMSPVGTVTRFSTEEQQLPTDARVELKTYQGRRMFGVELKLVGEDGQRVAHDGVATGELFVRGPAIVSGYYKSEADDTAKVLDSEGWFGTGDVARITPDGYLVIVDRTKDLIKSGGEWISSIDIENIAMGCPGIANAAVIAVPHPKWHERPLLVVVKAKGAEPTRESILAHLASQLAKWQLPDDIAFVDQIPLTATGKISKRELREQFEGHKLPK